MSTQRLDPAVPPSFDLRGRTALVTGATGGIGSAIARAYAAGGADLVLIADQDLTEVTDQVSGYGQAVTCVELDLGIRTHRRDTLDQLIVDHDVDVVVNSAGRIRRGPVLDLDPDDDWYDVLEVNLHAAFDVSRAAGRAMVTRGRGSIINIGSLLSFQGGLHAASYATSKHALAGLTRALANEWGGRGVNVNAIAPGYVETALVDELRADPVRRAEITARIPAGRWATPADIAGPAVFLASSASTYVHGHVLVVDGGWMSR